MSEQKKPIINLMTTDDLEKMFDVSKVTIWRWRKNGLLGYFMIGGKPRYSDKHIEGLLENLDKSKPMKKKRAA